MELQPGGLIGPFVLDQRIGDGAFTQVWQAHHTLSSAVVAIKVIEKTSTSTPIGCTRLILLDLLLGASQELSSGASLKLINSNGDMILLRFLSEARCNFDQWQRHGQ
jgi:serine/threonine protein kinase